MLDELIESAVVFTAGAVGGAVGTFVVARGAWRCAQSQGEVLDKCVTELREMRDAPPLPNGTEVRHATS